MNRSRERQLPNKPPKNETGKSIDTPEGKIRPGRRKPYKKATVAEQEQRIEALAVEMVRNPTMTKTEMHDFMRSKFNIEWGMTDTVYVVRAKKFLQDRANMTKTQAKSIGVNALLKALREAKGSQVAAIERRLGEIYGYDLPKQFRVTTPVGQPMEVKDDRPLKTVPTSRLVELATAFVAGGRDDGQN